MKIDCIGFFFIIFSYHIQIDMLALTFWPIDIFRYLEIFKILEIKKKNIKNVYFIHFNIIFCNSLITIFCINDLYLACV